MDIKTVFIFLLATYVIMVSLGSLEINGTSAHMAAPYITMIALLLIYAALAISLTIKIFHLSSFDWISSNREIVKIALYIGMATILYTVYSAFMIRLDWSTYQDTSIVDIKSFLAFSGYIWVPLLMIVPYTLIIYNIPLPGILLWYIKIPLIFNMLIGISLYLSFKRFF